MRYSYRHCRTLGKPEPHRRGNMDVTWTAAGSLTARSPSAVRQGIDVAAHSNHCQEPAMTTPAFPARRHRLANVVSALLAAAALACAPHAKASVFVSVNIAPP